MLSPKDRAASLVDQRRLAEARNLYEKICVTDPADADAWFRLGAVNGMLGDFDAAIKHSRRALSLDPLVAPAYENMGKALVRLGKGMEAVQCYWKMAMAMHGSGRFRETLAALNLILEVPVRLPAQQLAEIHANRGACHAMYGEYREAMSSYRKAVELQPDNPGYHLGLGDALSALVDFEQAQKTYRKLSRLQPDNPEVYARIANVYERMHDLDAAAIFARKALALDKGNITSQVTLAKVERRAGNLDVARDCLESARMMRSDPVAGAELYFELGQVYDRLGRPADAFDAFCSGNQQLLQIPSAKACQDAGTLYLKDLAAFERGYTVRRIQKWRHNISRDGLPDPVFLVGHPRSGTTLTEQILSAHSGTMVSDEQPMLRTVFLAIRNQVGGPAQVIDYLDRASQQELDDLRVLYWQEAEKTLGSGVRRTLLVDKNPLNLNHLGLIQRIFPDSRVLVALRDPRDVCLSCFMQKFQPNEAMVHCFDLENTARHYAAVMKLWLHYRAIVELRWMEFRYEDLVRDFTPTAQNLISFLGLQWEDAVLSYYEKERHVSTPSYQDVASPLFSRAIGRWQKYRAQMEPVLPLLVPFVREFGYKE